MKNILAYLCVLLFACLGCSPSELAQRVDGLNVPKVQDIVTEVMCRAEVLAPYAEYLTKDQLRDSCIVRRDPSQILEAAQVAADEIAAVKQKLELCE